MMWLELAGVALSGGVLGFAIGRWRRRVFIATLPDGAEAHWNDVCAGLTHAELQKRLK